MIATSLTDAPQRLHVIIIDGTLSRLDEGAETNAGLLYKMLLEQGPSPDQTVDYQPGAQGAGLRGWGRVATGGGVNDAIRAGYARLAQRYAPGDRIMLFGYSRGAYTVRSLAGLIDRIGLLRREHALDRLVGKAFRFYQHARPTPEMVAFTRERCHAGVGIDMVGVWDTVKALGLPYPILSRVFPLATEFHDDTLGPHIRNGYQALALDEDRSAYRPVLWRRRPGWTGALEQIWFPGAHGDVGGQVEEQPAARGLSDAAMLWMLDRAERHGLRLPDGWRDRLAPDPGVEMLGCRTGIARLFLLREARKVGGFHGEALHESVAARIRARPDYAPTARGHGIG